MQNIRKKENQVNFWLDLKASIENMLQFGTPEKLLEILDLMYEAFIHSEFADMREDRQNVSIEYGIFKDILKTMQKHSIATPFQFSDATV